MSGFFIIHFTITGPKNTVRYIRYVGVTLYRGLRYMGVRYIGALYRTFCHYWAEEYRSFIFRGLRFIGATL